MRKLSELVAGAAVKRLSAVEASLASSNQHEINGTVVYKSLFGDARKRFTANFLYLRDSEPAVISASGSVTWYDSRKNQPHRKPEFRLYFTHSDVADLIQPGDLAGVIRRHDNSVVIAFAEGSSTAEQQLLWLFDLLNTKKRGWSVADFKKTDREIGLAARAILSQLGIELEVAPDVEESHLALLISRYGSGFPLTREFSAFAREATEDVDPVEDPDGALLAWLEREEALFRQLERHLVLKRIRQGFGDDVEGFIKFSLSVQNRRKSRVGFALEHHTTAILRANGIAFSFDKATEGDAKPDFLFPSVAHYHNPDFQTDSLRMLAVKSTCKDRWRQVLAEADRIPRKHLLTLEPSISRSQTEQMTSKGVSLVIPTELQQTYSVDQRRGLISLKTFIRELKVLQAALPPSAIG